MVRVKNVPRCVLPLHVIVQHTLENCIPLIRSYTLRECTFTKVCLLENRHESSLKTMILCMAEYRSSLNILTTNLHIQVRTTTTTKKLRKLPLVHVKDPTSIWQPQYTCVDIHEKQGTTHTRHTVDSQRTQTHIHTHDSHNLWVESYPWRYAKLSFHKHLRNTVPTFPLLCTFF